MKRITDLLRGLTQIRGGAIYALQIACVAPALALYSCSEPPAPQQPTPLPSTPAIVAATPVPATPTPLPPSAQLQATPIPTPSPTPAIPTNQSPPPPLVEPTPTPTAVPDFVPLPVDAQFTHIAAGKLHACGLQPDGTPLCWGHNINGSLEIPGGYLTLSQIAAGLNFTCGLRADGVIACWGQNTFGQASPPDGRFDEIAAGSVLACALNGGALTCWGGGFAAAGETIQEIPPLSAIQGGGGLICGLTVDADMACLDGSELAITPGPFISLGIGLQHACAIRTDGSIFCEDAHYSRRSLPPSTKFAQIAGGWYHTCGITESSGDLECWGSNVPGASEERLSAPEGEFTTISIGWRNSCALRPNGQATCWQQPDVQNPSELHMDKAIGGVIFERPVDIFPLQDGRLAVVDRKGIIEAYSDEPNAAPPKTMLDLTDKTACCSAESGMLSAALDPQFEKFPFLYVYYRVVSKHAYGEDMRGLAGRLARFRVESGRAIRDSELTIVEAPQPRKYHYGGVIRFGADGMLYLGIGDNFSSEKAQSLDTLLGKIIRIDVRGATSEQPYRVPPDNPFVNNPNALPEIWAYGLRNPWRMDFAPDGRLFIADVGAITQEEISLASASANLGWPMCEGNICEEGMESDAYGLTAPIFTYGREDGCAIIGGVTTTRLDNGFVFGDYCSRRVWILEQQGGREGWQARMLAQMEGLIMSFGIDANGWVYVLSRHNPIMRLQIDGEE